MKIDKKIPIPLNDKRGANAKIIEKMKIGDSIFFDNNKLMEARRFYGCCYNTFRKWRFTSRTTKEGIRIWRIE